MFNYSARTHRVGSSAHYTIMKSYFNRNFMQTIKYPCFSGY